MLCNIISRAFHEKGSHVSIDYVGTAENRGQLDIFKEVWYNQWNDFKEELLWGTHYPLEQSDGQCTL